jgi:tetratricopeptide (TPR) repeat protein
MKKLIREAHRRSLWQVLGIYLVGSWIALQVVDVLAQNMTLPDWVFPFALVLLVIGLPIVMATAFVQEGMAGHQSSLAPASRVAREIPGGQEGVARAEEHAVSGPAEDMAAAGGAHHWIFTWRNALLGGAAALTLLGVVTAGWMVTRTLGIGPAATLVAQGLLDERAPILLAEFEADDPLLSRAATEAFRVDLDQSPIVRLVEPAFISGALKRMGREPTGGLDVDLTREVAIREGIQAVVAGDIVAVGGGYVLSARVMAPGDGAVLVSHRETAADSSEIIRAIDNLSRRLRERMGESLASIRADPPLERVTTPNLDALRKYSQAMQAIDVEGDIDRAIALLDEAVALDTAFAMAYRKLAVELSNREEQRRREIEAITKAFENRERLTETERYVTMGSYYTAVGPDLNRAVAAYENALVIDPNQGTALNNLGVIELAMRNPERAREYYNRALDTDSSTALYWGNLASTLHSVGEAPAALELLARAEVRFPDNPLVDTRAAWIAAAEGDYEEARERFEAARRKEPGSSARQVAIEMGLASIDAIQGKLRAARAHHAEALNADEGREQGARYLSNAAWLATLESSIGNDEQQAMETLDAALDRFSLDSLDVLDRPYVDLALAYAAAGEARRAEVLLAAYETNVPAELQSERGLSDPATLARGHIAMARRDYDDAISRFERLDEGLCWLCGVHGLARAYDLAGTADSAVATYERYVGTPWIRRWETDPFDLASSLERLGQLYDEQGEWEKAAEYYARFVELWRDADPELQPRVKAAQRRLDEIFAQKG